MSPASGPISTHRRSCHDCIAASAICTPRPVWNPDEPNPFRYREMWQLLPDADDYPNAFRLQWEQFLLHLATGSAFPHTFREGARGVQMAEAAMQSWQERRWVEIGSLAGDE